MENYNDITLKISEVVTKNYSTSFYTASLLFPKAIRGGIFGIYGFVRFADEIVDTFHQYNKEELLNKFETDLKDALDKGISLNPVLHSFVLVVKKYNIEYHLIDAFLDSMRKDLSITKYESDKEIDTYIYGSAEVVGLMCLKVFCDGDNEQYQHLTYSAKKLGAAFQKVNFIRDLNADIFELKRTYFPDIKNNTFDESIKSQIIATIEKDFREAYQGIKELPEQAQTAVYISYLYYKKLLKKIKNTPAETILNQRIRVPNYIKLMLILKGVVSSKFKII